MLRRPSRKKAERMGAKWPIVVSCTAVLATDRFGSPIILSLMTTMIARPWRRLGCLAMPPATSSATIQLRLRSRWRWIDDPPFRKDSPGEDRKANLCAGSTGHRFRRSIRQHGKNSLAGSIRFYLSSPLRKNISSSHPTQITSLFAAVPSHLRGGSRSSRTRGGMRWTWRCF